MAWLSILGERAIKEDEKLTLPTKDAERAFIASPVMVDRQVRAAKGRVSEGEERSIESDSSGEEEEDLSPRDGTKPKVNGAT